MTVPRFAVALNHVGTPHILSVSHVDFYDEAGQPESLTGIAFCGGPSDSLWTNWSEYVDIDVLCKRCLKGLLRGLREESDAGAKAELEALLGVEVGA